MSDNITVHPLIETFRSVCEQYRQHENPEAGVDCYYDRYSDDKLSINTRINTSKIITDNTEILFNNGINIVSNPENSQVSRLIEDDNDIALFFEDKDKFWNK